MLRRRLHEILFDQETDANEVQSLSEQIGRLQARLEWTKYEHLLAIREICTPDQMERFHALLDDVMRMSRPPEFPGRGRGRGIGPRGPGYGPPGSEGLGPRGPFGPPRGGPNGGRMPPQPFDPPPPEHPAPPEQETLPADSGN